MRGFAADRRENIALELAWGDASASDRCLISERDLQDNAAFAGLESMLLPGRPTRIIPSEVPFAEGCVVLANERLLG